MSSEIIDEIAGINPKCQGCPWVELCTTIIGQDRRDTTAAVNHTMDRMSEDQSPEAADDGSAPARSSDMLIITSIASVEAGTRVNDLNEKSVVEATAMCHGLNKKPNFIQRLLGKQALCGLDLGSQSVHLPKSMSAFTNPEANSIREAAKARIGRHR